MKIFKKIRILVAAVALLTLFILAGCGGGGGGPTAPATPPELTGFRVENEQPVNSGATIILHIDYIDPAAKMNEGTAYITYSEGTYEAAVSNAPGSTGTMLVAFELSPLVKPGRQLLSVWVRNSAGTPSSTIQIPLDIK